MLIGLALSLAKGLLGFAEKRSSDQVERFRIETGLDETEIKAGVELGAQAASVVKRAMGFKIFWIPWFIAATPLSAWFGWGVLDSLILEGAVLPDIATLPPQIKEYADIVWRNIFYSGAGVASVQTASRVIAGALGRR